MIKEKDLYFLAVKVFLENKGKLFISKDRFGDWDLPGGRLLPAEFNTSFEKVLARKIKEELGKNVKYKLGQPIVFMRHERTEILLDGKKSKRRIFAIGYQAKYLGGAIQLGKNHEQSKWLEINKLKPEIYFKGGWLKGIKDYLKKTKK
ncbi:MAG: NUDIX domain-containing protein [Candidatus Falkowbacteria bacterium]|nr:NUDIX domain-containing protein [Candidatus Falkowbacteria bacterium]